MEDFRGEIRETEVIGVAMVKARRPNRAKTRKRRQCILSYAAEQRKQRKKRFKLAMVELL